MPCLRCWGRVSRLVAAEGSLFGTLLFYSLVTQIFHSGTIAYPACSARGLASSVRVLFPGADVCEISFLFQRTYLLGAGYVDFNDLGELDTKTKRRLLDMDHYL